MVDIRLIALDLDGTLLDSQKRLSVRNREVLEECLRRGIHIVPTTGRTVDGIPDMIKAVSYTHLLENDFSTSWQNWR